MRPERWDWTELYTSHTWVWDESELGVCSVGHREGLRRSLWRDLEGGHEMGRFRHQVSSSGEHKHRYHQCVVRSMTLWMMNVYLCCRSIWINIRTGCRVCLSTPVWPWPLKVFWVSLDTTVRAQRSGWETHFSLCYCPKTPDTDTLMCALNTRRYLRWFVRFLVRLR